jgi:hypothetical protein
VHSTQTESSKESEPIHSMYIHDHQYIIQTKKQKNNSNSVTKKAKNELEGINTQKNNE